MGRSTILIFGVTVVVCLAGIARAQQPDPAPSARAELRAWWAHYRDTFIMEDGRVARPEHGGDTVSEGQAYAMLSAALLADRETFDRVWQWTHAHLSRADRFNDHLLAWHWRDGEVADWNAASDADLDALFALLLAWQLWRDESHKRAALHMAADVLEHEVVETELGLILLPGTWGDEDPARIVINPSYLSPAAFGTLFELTGDPRWRELRETTWAVWARSSEQLARTDGVGLAPDWCAVTEDGDLVHAKGRSSAYGWEALRVPMRASLDLLMMDSVPSNRFLIRRPLPFFRAQFQEGATHLAATYAYWGSPADPSESLAMSATALFAFEATGLRPPQQLVASFERQRRNEHFQRNYYAQSLLFYPLALRAGVFDSFGTDILQRR